LNISVKIKINPNISGEEGHNWTIDSCDKMRSNEYDLIAHNCQDIKRKILEAFK
jgi:hypothetical protein